ncbi:MAG: methylated-DNA--[protein]-cysteine S-methyltransferase [Bacteroidota bacterium]|nr:methylated-DNA--[protein]-cysteine S-methyltransferase [Bacteroidota bacterium]MDP4231227.1 methylated-DNA--[protein]-cysteine S-methyltransferase [Bacteroidota bacterium]MDP4235759.1 methylated-DNA--[protein]-cysteine S-methyltransferase [Bacteroidota bacterium]
MEAAYYHSPLGTIEVRAGSEGISSVSFIDSSPETSSTLPLLHECVHQLNEYFSGSRKEFSLPLAPEGTAFQKEVWRQLLHIPFGKTRSYLDIAVALGDKNSTRAVGAANGKNPIAIIVPCHRVIGESGALTGYAGGLWRKQWLLEHEGANNQGDLFK